MSITAVNVRNQFPRHRHRSHRRTGRLPRWTCACPRAAITSVITTRSVRTWGLAPGREVVALVKPTEVSIATL